MGVYIMPCGYVTEKKVGKNAKIFKIMSEKMLDTEEERLNDSVPLELLIKYLVAERKKLQTELGKERAYIEELEDELSSVRKKLKLCEDSYNNYKISHKVFYDGISKEDGIQATKFEYDYMKAKLSKEVKKWQKQRDELLCTLKKYSDILNYYELI